MRWVPRIGEVNAVLVALYLAPLSAIEALRALMSPVYGLDSRVNLAAAAFYRQLFDLDGEGLVRVASMLAALKLVTAAMFLALVIDVARGIAVRRESDPATVDAALFISALTVILWAIPAYANGSGELIRLYSAQFLLIIGAIVVVLIERIISPAPARVTRASLWFALSEVEKDRARAAIAQATTQAAIAQTVIASVSPAIDAEPAREPEPAV